VSSVIYLLAVWSSQSPVAAPGVSWCRSFSSVRWSVEYV